SCRVDEDVTWSAYRPGRGKDMHAVLGRQFGVESVHLVGQAGDGSKGALQITRNFAAKGGSDLNGPVFGKHEELGASLCAAGNPAGSILPPFGHRGRLIDGILRDSDFDPIGSGHQSGLIQNCIGFSVSSGWSMSFQLSLPIMPSTMR